MENSKEYESAKKRVAAKMGFLHAPVGLYRRHFVACNHQSDDLSQRHLVSLADVGLGDRNRDSCSICFRFPGSDRRDGKNDRKGDGAVLNEGIKKRQTTHQSPGTLLSSAPVWEG